MLDKRSLRVDVLTLLRERHSQTIRRLEQAIWIKLEHASGWFQSRDVLHVDVVIHKVMFRVARERRRVGDALKKVFRADLFFYWGEIVSVCVWADVDERST